MRQIPGCTNWGRSSTSWLNRPFLFIWLPILTFALVTGARAGAWEAPAWADTLKSPVQLDSAARAEAAALYQKNCSVCHGQTGKGDGMMAQGMQPPPADFADDPDLPYDPIGGLYWKILTGRKPMPGWKKDLNQEQIWALAQYIKTLGPPAAPDSLKAAPPDTTRQR